MSLSREEFEKVYVTLYPKALAILMRAGLTKDRAEEAVQNASVYILQRIEKGTLDQLTPSYWLQCCANNGKMVQRGERRRYAYERRDANDLPRWESSGGGDDEDPDSSNGD